ncbi:MAG: hypothetical protein U5K54_17610 [Cytophagales bacterium]|nr:hypothetical protein [Cytophagales bacterium]
MKKNDQVVGYAGGMLVDGTLAHGSASSLTQHTFNDAIKSILDSPMAFVSPRFYFHAINCLHQKMLHECCSNDYGKQKSQALIYRRNHTWV